MNRNLGLTSLPVGRTFLLCLILAVVTLAAYWPVLGCGFLNYDDDLYVTENPYVLKGLSLEGIQWAFLSVGCASNWHPLTWLSHMLDCQLFGQHAGLHHLTSLLIHTASVMLLLWILGSMTGRLGPSVFVAAVFAIHPLHVESVAWIAERKDVLSGFFWVLTMACYLRYTRTRSRGSYLVTLFFFGLGLLAKPMLVTLPFVLLLLDFWPLNRLDRGSARARIAEKIPFLILSAASCVVTVIAQKAGGAVWDMESLPFAARLSNAVVSYMAYIVKAVWPVRLAVLYPLRQIPPWQFISAFIVLITVTVIALLLIRRKRYVAVGWLWYVSTLIPVIGLVQVGVQCLADRYTYIPLIGLCLMAAWAVSDVCQKRPALRSVSVLTGILLLAAMFAGTRNQLRYWTDSISLCSRAIRVTENNYIMHNNLGNALFDNGQLEEAMNHFHRVLQIDPDNADAYNNLGLALSKTGPLNEAIMHYRRALQIDPDNADAYNNLGNAFVKDGQFDEAMIQYRRALQINPDKAETYNNLGFVLSKIGQLDEAMNLYHRALQIHPDYTDAHNNLGNALLDIGQLDEAMNHFRRVLQIDPAYADAYYNLGNALIEAGQWEEAITQYRRVLQINPDDVNAYINLGLALSKTGQLDEAIMHYRHALQIDPDNVKIYNNIGNAFARAGQWDKAIVQYRRVLQIDPDNTDALFNLGNALKQMDQLDEAIVQYRQALQNNPDDAKSHYHLGILLDDRGHPAEAITHYRRLIELQPDFPAGLNNLAWILATASDPALRNPPEAIELAQKACELTEYQDPSMMHTLAAAYAAAGRIDKAISTAEKALALARSKGDENLLLKLSEDLKRFQEGSAVTDNPP